MKRVSILSMHTSPLAQPGVGDGGGMNVYVRELVSALAHAGLDCTTYTRAWQAGLPEVVNVEPNHRVVHIPAGSFDLPKNELLSVVDEFSDNVRAHIVGSGGVDVLHANYWLSGLSAHKLKHELDLPLVTTFHTLARVKAQGGDFESDIREQSESDIIGCADAICVSCTEEERQFIDLYGNPPGTLEIVAPGVEHAFFAPGEKRGARHALGIAFDVPVLLCVGRIQPLKGLDVAIQALAQLQADIQGDDWKAKVFTSNTAGSDLESWGSPIWEGSANDGPTITATFSSPSQFALVYLTQIGKSGFCSNNNPYRGYISEIRILSGP